MQAFIGLRDQFDVGTSEMEMATLLRLSAQLTHLAKQKNGKEKEKENEKDKDHLCHTPVKCGCILMALGTLPGDSFLDPSKFDFTSVGKLQWKIALETLHRVSLRYVVRQ